MPDNTTHTDIPNETCQDCHKVAEPPSISHTLEGRENCLECHETTEEGAMVALELPPAEEAPPEEEAGPTPTPTPEPIPTPLTFPRIEGVNGCLDCHQTLDDEQHVEITTQWQRSIHSERDVVCVDCHGRRPFG